MYREGTWRPLVRLKSSIRFDEECGEGKRQENNPADDCHYGNETKETTLWSRRRQTHTDDRRIFSRALCNSNSKRENCTRSDRYLLGDHSPSDHSQSCAQAVAKGSTHRHSKWILGISAMENYSLSRTQKTPKDKCRLFVCGLKGSGDVISVALVWPEGEIQVWQTSFGK